MTHCYTHESDWFETIEIEKVNSFSKGNIPKEFSLVNSLQNEVLFKGITLKRFAWNTFHTNRKSGASYQRVEGKKTEITELTFIGNEWAEKRRTILFPETISGGNLDISWEIRSEIAKTNPSFSGHRSITDHFIWFNFDSAGWFWRIVAREL